MARSVNRTRVRSRAEYIPSPHEIPDPVYRRMFESMQRQIDDLLKTVETKNTGAGRVWSFDAFTRAEIADGKLRIYGRTWSFPDDGGLPRRGSEKLMSTVDVANDSKVGTGSSGSGVSGTVAGTTNVNGVIVYTGWLRP